MYTCSRTIRTTRKRVGRLAVLWLCFAVSGLNGASAEPPTPVAEPVLFNGSWKCMAAEKPRSARRSDGTESRVQGRATALLQKALSPPQEVPVPRHIPMYRKSGEQTAFPRHGYEDTYFQGWNECLYVVGSANAQIHGEIMTPCLTSFNNNWESGAGLVAGFHDCQRRIIFLANIYNLDLIRATEKELHREIAGGVAWDRKKPTGNGRSPDHVDVGKKAEKASRKTPIKAGIDQ